jgi:hypothetical protein
MVFEISDNTQNPSMSVGDLSSTDESLPVATNSHLATGQSAAME